MAASSGHNAVVEAWLAGVKYVLVGNAKFSTNELALVFAADCRKNLCTHMSAYLYSRNTNAASCGIDQNNVSGLETRKINETIQCCATDAQQDSS